MGIDTIMEGSPDEVAAAATWLSDLEGKLDEASRLAMSARSQSLTAWQGETAAAYWDLAYDLVRATDEIGGRVKEAAEKTRAYAQQLRWRQEDMAGHRDEARGAGLTVNGTVIEQPADAPAVPDLPAGSTPEQAAAHQKALDEHDAQVKKIDAYNALVDKVDGTNIRLNAWVKDNLDPELDRVTETPLIAALVSAAMVVKNVDMAHPTDFGEKHFESKAKDLEKQADAYATALARRRSGNPAVRAGAKDPTPSGVANAKKPGTKAGNTLAEASKLEGWAKWFKRGGIVLAGVAAGLEIASGESPSGVAVETAGSAVGAVAGGVVVGAAAAALGLAAAPVVVTVGAGILAGAAAGWVAKNAYEHFVPQDIRDKIDEGLRDTGDAVGDAVSGAWHSVFG